MIDLLDNLMQFVSVIRLAGVRTSTSEVLDAVNALESVDLSDKAAVKAALSACLAKSEEERAIFSKAFEAFFVLPEARQEFINSKRKAAEAAREDIERQAQDLKFKGEQIELTDELKEVYAKLGEDEKQSIKDYLDRTSAGKNVKREFKHVAEAMVHSRLNSARRNMESAGHSFNAFNEYDQYNAFEQYGGYGSDAGIVAEEVRNAVKSEETLLHKNIAGINEDEVPAAVRIIKRLADALKKRLRRKYGSTHKKRRLDIKNTIHSSMSTGGLMFKLKYKTRKKRKDRFFVLCDVSASMHRFSGFVLQFIQSMHSDTAATEAYIFSDDIERLKLTDAQDFESFSEQVRKSRIWRKGTNIRAALQYFIDRAGNLINSSSIIIIVSDAKTLEAAVAAEKLKELGKRAGKLIWLNPVPEKEWGSIPYLSEYLKACTMLDCSTLGKLALACSRLGS